MITIYCGVEIYKLETFFQTLTLDSRKNTHFLPNKMRGADFCANNLSGLWRLLKYLLFQLEDLSLDPQHQWKSTDTYVCNLRADHAVKTG